MMEMIQGEFSRKFKEASCYIQQTEPFTPWLVAGEKEIKELKSNFERKMIKSKAPKMIA